MLELLVDIWRLFFGQKNGRIPTKYEIAEMIDQRLGQDNGRDDGKIIRVQKGGYRYYITRSPIGKER